MIKVMTFLESAVASIESELNKHMSKYDIVYVWSTGSRLVVILKERAQRGRPVTKKEDIED